MTSTTCFQYLWSLFFLLPLCFVPSISTSNLHIVYLGHNHGHDPLLTTNSHIQLLSKVFTKEDEAKSAIIYNYKHSFSGFAAMLNSTQATTLSNMEGVVSVFRSRMLQLHTTRSWDFMGLTYGSGQGLTTPFQFKYGHDIIVGVFDTGVWPESESFQEEPGIPPIPMAWKGQCVKGENFDPATACNRKLIGARYYLAGFERDYGPLDPSSSTEYRSPRDALGHGSHTSSTAVGSASRNASFFGLAAGTAHGGAPRARLAMYKICWFKDLQGRCSEADIMAAFDDALHDGVHVISASIGASPPLMPFFASGTEIGSFHAAQMGVVAVFSAGNDGPDPSLVQNVAPWSLCVAAGTIDRRFPTEIKMPNNATFVGEGFITENMQMQLIDSSQIFTDGSCSTDKWNGIRATKKIILCFSSIGPVSSFGAAIATYVANGSGVIFVDAKVKLTAQDDFIPTVHVDLHQGTQILYQIQSSPKFPVVQISRSKTSIGRTPAPTIAFFSSRGPNSLSPNILKPDITAPGVNILAAWPPKTPPTLIQIDKRSVNWNFDSGTSMSCPHISGIVALLKSAHPTWSPAMIKSALMTTAYMGDTTADSILAGGSLKAADAFDLGAGYVNPLKAMDPGLVYDMNTQDYIYYLCSLGYTKEQLKLIVIPSPDIKIECMMGNKHSDLDLNYPAIVLSDLQSSSITVKRTLWNVGRVGAAYFASVVSPQGVVAFVWPRYIVFSNEKEKVSYYVTVKAVKKSQGRFDFGEIVWCDGYHHVRTPLVVRVNNV